MHTRSTMGPEHPSWADFLSRLDQADRCKRTTEHARRILETMTGIDVNASLLALAERGGYCDCAILYDLSGWAVA